MRVACQSQVRETWTPKGFGRANPKDHADRSAIRRPRFHLWDEHRDSPPIVIELVEGELRLHSAFEPPRRSTGPRSPSRHRRPRLKRRRSRPPGRMGHVRAAIACRVRRRGGRSVWADNPWLAFDRATIRGRAERFAPVAKSCASPRASSEATCGAGGAISCRAGWTRGTLTRSTCACHGDRAANFSRETA